MAFQRLLAARPKGSASPPPCLVMAGWTEEGSEAFLRALADLASGVGRNLPAPRPDKARKRRILGAAVIFLSPVDNLQGTFGLATEAWQGGETQRAVNQAVAGVGR